MSAATKSALLVVNPAAGSGRGTRWLPRVEDGLRGAGWRVHVVETAAPGDARRAAADPAFSLAVAMGGDGTVNEVLNGLTGREAALAVVPAGTANVLARELRIGNSLPRALEAIRGGRVARVDLGEANGRRFLLMAGIGFDAEVILELEKIRTGAIGLLTYVGPALRAWGRYPGPPFRVIGNGGTATPAFRFAAFGNVRWYAGPFRLTPRASMRDGLLDLCGFRGTGRFDLARFYAGALLGIHPTFRDCHYSRSPSFAVREAGIPIQVDGESAGRTPVEIKVLPAAQRLVVPDGWGRGLVRV